MDFGGQIGAQLGSKTNQKSIPKNILKTNAKKKAIRRRLGAPVGVGSRAGGVIIIRSLNCLSAYTPFNLKRFRDVDCNALSLTSKSLPTIIYDPRNIGKYSTANYQRYPYTFAWS